MNAEVLKRLNSKFAEFGLRPDGTPIFQWARTEDLFFLVDNGFKEVVTPGNITLATGTAAKPIALVERTHKVVTYAEMMGARWCLAQWGPPRCNEFTWRQMLGDTAPYPRGGEIHPIENLALFPGKEPNEILTEVFVQAVRMHMKRTDAERLESIKAHEASVNKAAKNEILDEMIDQEGAFGNDNPGSRSGSVSFPSVQPQPQGATIQ